MAQDLSKLNTEDLLKELASRETADPAADPNVKNPAHEEAANRIAAAFDDENYRRQNDPENKLPVIKGNHTPIHWRLLPDGVTLRVVLESGPMLEGPLNGENIVQRAVRGAVKLAQELASMDTRQASLDEREAELNLREKQINDAAKKLEEMQTPPKK